MTGDDFALTAGWGHLGQGETVMPGQDRVVGRAYTLEERAALGEVVSTLGGMTFDVYLNNRATGATSPPRFGATRSAAARSSRSGRHTASKRPASWDGR